MRGTTFAPFTDRLFRQGMESGPVLSLQVDEMNTEQEKIVEDRPADHEDGETIDQAFVQMEVLYRSRCVQAPNGNNITVREIKKEE